jgi:hypothetical protein
MAIPIIWCYMQLPWPNSTLRYIIFSYIPPCIWINVRESRRENHKWTIHWKQDEDKNKTKQNKHKRTTPKTKTIINTDPTTPRGWTKVLVKTQTPPKPGVNLGAGENTDPTKTRGELMCWWRVSNSWLLYDIRHVTNIVLRYWTYVIL